MLEMLFIPEATATFDVPLFQIKPSHDTKFAAPTEA
jgi:hypothetical protein